LTTGGGDASGRKRAIPRLARALLLLANYGNDLGQEPIPVKVNQQTLAALIGTTRSRVNVFMNKFRKLDLIEYNGKLEVQKALLNFVLNGRPHIERWNYRARALITAATNDEDRC
jgi:hypothetical protein